MLQFWDYQLCEEGYLYEEKLKLCCTPTTENQIMQRYGKPAIDRYKTLYFKR